MIKKLTRHGEDWAIVIDQPVLDQLQIDHETPLEVTTVGQSLIVTRAADADRQVRFEAAIRATTEREPCRQARFESAIQKTNERFGGALRRLAE